MRLRKMKRKEELGERETDRKRISKYNLIK